MTKVLSRDVASDFVSAPLVGGTRVPLLFLFSLAFSFLIYHASPHGPPVLFCAATHVIMMRSLRH
jgi:hypothetical protein